MIFARIPQRSLRPAEQVSRLLDLAADAGQVRQFEWRTILPDQVDQRDVVERQIPVFKVKTTLGKVERLVN